MTFCLYRHPEIVDIHNTFCWRLTPSSSRLSDNGIIVFVLIRLCPAHVSFRPEPSTASIWPVSTLLFPFHAQHLFKFSCNSRSISAHCMNFTVIEKTATKLPCSSSYSMVSLNCSSSSSSINPSTSIRLSVANLPSSGQAGWQRSLIINVTISASHTCHSSPLTNLQSFSFPH